MSILNFEAVVRQSKWWRLAAATPDRHGDASSGVSLADHLDAVLENLRRLLISELAGDFVLQVQQRLDAIGIDRQRAFQTLMPVALLHDLGKLTEDKLTTIPHPLSGKPAPKRHPVASVLVAMELLPPSMENRECMLALIDEHATPFSWYAQFRHGGRAPGPAAWARLDHKIDPRGDGSGLLLLALFKMADIAGHENLDDVSWFVGRANEGYLASRGKELPVPDVRLLRQVGREDGGYFD